jgi:hypothetical protein
MIGAMFPVESIIYSKGKSIYVEKSANVSCVVVMSTWYSLFENVGGGIWVFMKFGVSFITLGSMSFLFLAEHRYWLFL